LYFFVFLVFFFFSRIEKRRISSTHSPAHDKPVSSSAPRIQRREKTSFHAAIR